jgi:hypothetical protein
VTQNVRSQVPQGLSSKFGNSESSGMECLFYIFGYDTHRCLVCAEQWSRTP